MSKIARGKAMWLLLSVLVLLGLVALMQGGATPPAGAQPPSAPKFTRKVMVDNSVGAEINARFTKEGAILLTEYELSNRNLWRITDEQAATLVNQWNHPIPGINFVEEAEYSAIDEPLDNIPANLRQTKIEGYQVWRIKFVGPIKNEWWQILFDMGIQRIDSNIWVTGKQIEQLEAMAASKRSFVEWTGPSHPAQRLHKDLHPGGKKYLYLSNEQEFVEASFMFYQHTGTDETIARLQALAKPNRIKPWVAYNKVYIRLAIPANQFVNIANWPDTLHIEPWSPPKPSDEVQDQIVARDKVN